MSVSQELKANSQKRLLPLFRLTPHALLFTLLFVSAVWSGWVRQPTSSGGPEVFSVEAIDSLQAWFSSTAFEDSQPPIPYFTTLCFTSDGGANWVVNDTIWVYKANDLEFKGARHGWCVGDWNVPPYNSVYYTTDGGVSWIGTGRADTVGNLKRVSFYDTLGGWAISDPNGYDLYHTTDGGNTWRRRFLNLDFGEDIQFIDSLHGWVVGYDVGYGARVFRTVDGGQTWDSIAPPGVQIFHAVDFIDFLRGWGACDSAAGVMVTTNGGLTWSTQVRDAVEFTSIDFVDSLHGWASARWPGQIFATSDGGMTWAKQWGPDTFKVIDDISFADKFNGWAVGDSTYYPYYYPLVLHTSDGGWSGVEEERAGLPPVSGLPLRIAPNPFTSFATVPGHSSDRFALYDVSGRRVGVYKGDRIGEGLSAGVYFLRPEGKDAKPLRVVKVR